MQQEMRGIKFDVAKAKANVIELDQLMKEIEDFVEPQLPKRKLPKSKLKMPPKNQFKRNGEPSALAEKYFGEVRRIDDKWVAVEHNLALPHHEPLVSHGNMKLADHGDIKKWLMSLGWKPTNWNYKKDSNSKYVRENGKLIKTSPKFTDQQKNICPNLEKLAGKVKLVEPIVYWLSYRNRRSVIKTKDPKKDTGWLNNPRLNIDGRLPSGADTIGTNTCRFTHKCVANIPRVSSIYGRQMRELFTTDLDKYYFIGWDASGLEARIDGHYTYRYDRGERAKELTEGDIHSKNAAIFGCDRSTAKGGAYCLAYGGSAGKLAETIGVDKADGERLYQEYWKQNWALAKLKENLTKFWETTGQKKWILGLDGRRIFTRSAHSLVNALFQSAGIICMKEAMIIMEERANDYNANGLVRYHDEEQWEVAKDLVTFKMFKTEEEAEEFTDDSKLWGAVQESPKGGYYRAYSIIGELGVKSIREAGKKLGLNVPLDGEYKVGRNWAETH